MNARKTPFLFIGGLCLLMTLVSCDRRSRLTVSDVDFQIVPPASSLQVGETLTLVAQGTARGGPVTVNPTWTVSSSVGELNTTIGPSVILEGKALGDVVVTATFQDLQTTGSYPVVAFIPDARTFNIYTDDGLPTGDGSDIFVLGALSLSELSSGYTPEGINYQQATNGLSGRGWGVTLDINSTGNTRDLSAFGAPGTNSQLKFTIRLGRPLSSVLEVLRVIVADEGTSFPVVLTSAHGFDPIVSGEWQEISVPISSFGANAAAIRVPFTIELFVVTSDLTFDIDAVRWDKNS